MAKKLNKRQLAYCYYKARNCTIEQAMEKAGYRCRGNSARAIGSELEKNPNISKQIEREITNIFDVKKINLEYLTEKANEIVLNPENQANKLRAIELLAKLTGNWVDKKHVDAEVTSKEDQAIIDKYMYGNSMKKSEGGDI